MFKRSLWGHKKICRGNNLDAESKMKMLKPSDEKRKMQKEYDEMMKIEIHSEAMESTSFYFNIVPTDETENRNQNNGQLV